MEDKKGLIIAMSSKRNNQMPAVWKRQKNLQYGFSLIESLICLSLFLFILLSSLEFFGLTRKIFLKLKSQQETKLAALTALDKMKTDLLNGGSGISEPIRLGVLEGITENNDALVVFSRERDLPLHDELVSGQTRISLEETKTIKKGRDLCIFNSKKGETKSISSVSQNSIILSSPLEFSYKKEKSRMILLKKISFYLDKETLRRKVNSSPAQPLLEDAALFAFDYEKISNLIRLCIKLKENKEKEYEASVFPKNTALAAGQ